MPLQVASFAAGVPAAQVLTTAPPTQLCMPVRAQAPTPQVVTLGTYVIGSQTPTVSVAGLLVSAPTVLLTVTVNTAPSSAATALASVYEPVVAPAIATLLRFHWN